MVVITLTPWIKSLPYEPYPSSTIQSTSSAFIVYFSLEVFNMWGHVF